MVDLLAHDLLDIGSREMEQVSPGAIKRIKIRAWVARWRRLNFSPAPQRRRRNAMSKTLDDLIAELEQAWALAEAQKDPTAMIEAAGSGPCSCGWSPTRSSYALWWTGMARQSSRLLPDL